MNLKKCILTANDCYKKGTKMNSGKPTGIVVHSTGVNNPTLKRYVQPLKTDENHTEIFEDLGTNIHGNHWNQSSASLGRSVCVHAFIGKTAKGEIATYQTLPFDICCWGVGNGSKGTYNYNPQARVQFEICEDGLTDKAYFTAVFKESAEFCAYLCKLYGIPVEKISSHAESHKDGYGSNHGDCDHWLKKFGKTMNDFRNDVEVILKADGKPKPEPQPETKPSGIFKDGDIVEFTGDKHYVTANAKSGVVCKPGKAKVTALYPKGTHPYHLICESGGGSTVYGWVDAADIKGVIAAPAKPVKPAPNVSTSAETIKVGDKVKCKSGVTKFSNGTNMAKWVPTSILYVRAIEQGDKICLVSTEKTKAVYTGRVKASDIYKI